MTKMVSSTGGDDKCASSTGSVNDKEVSTTRGGTIVVVQMLAPMVPLGGLSCTFFFGLGNAVIGRSVGLPKEVTLKAFSKTLLLLVNFEGHPPTHVKWGRTRKSGAHPNFCVEKT